MKFKIKAANDLVHVFIFRWLLNLFRNDVEDDVNESSYYSEKYNFYFNSMSQYWIEIGKKNALLEIISSKNKGGLYGMSVNEVIQKASRYEFGIGHGVVLCNIDLLSVGRMLSSFHGVNASVFKEDFVFIKTENREQTRNIINKIPTTMATALGISDGLIFISNEG